MAGPTCTEVPTSNLLRASLILDAFDGSDRLNLSQIATRTGLPRSSVHRTLERLVAMRWVRRQDNEYELGMRIVELGSAAVHQNRLRQAALPSLYRLHRATGGVVHLGVLDGSDVIYLEKIGGQLAPVVPSRVGGRLPAHSSAIGKALLAFQDSAAAPAAELRRIRDTRVASEREQCLRGFGCVAAPIGTPDGECIVAAVSVCTPVDWAASDDRLRTPVRLAAADIWREMQGIPGRFPRRRILPDPAAYDSLS